MEEIKVVTIKTDDWKALHKYDSKKDLVIGFYEEKDKIYNDVVNWHRRSEDSNYIYRIGELFDFDVNLIGFTIIINGNINSIKEFI